MERTLVLIKPDAIQRGLAGEIISRIESRGLQIAAMKIVHLDKNMANRHYEAHVGKPFFEGLVQFITSRPIIAVVFQGHNAVGLIRNTMGATDPHDAAAGTIRGDLAINIGRNLIHGSDSSDSAQREISLFFSPQEIIDYEREVEPWITKP